MSNFGGNAPLGFGALTPDSCCYAAVGVLYLAPWDAWQQSWGYAFGNNWGQMLDPISREPDPNNSSQTITQIAPAFADVGECSAIDIDVRESTQRLARYDGCGGEQCATTTLDGIDVSITLDCLSSSNLAQGFAGQLSDLPAEVPGMQSWGYGWGSGWGANPEPLDSQGNPMPIPQGIALKRLAAFTQCVRKPVALLFVGRNLVDGSGLHVFFPKVKLGSAKKRSLITNDFASISLTGSLLHAGDRGVGRSPWFDETWTT